MPTRETGVAGIDKMPVASGICSREKPRRLVPLRNDTVTRILAAIAAMIGIILIAGANVSQAAGIGLLLFAAIISFNHIVERLEQIERVVKDVRDHADAVRLNDDLARRAARTSRPDAEEHDAAEPG